MADKRGDSSLTKLFFSRSLSKLTHCLAPNSWLKAENGHYIRGRMPDFKAQHPKVWDQIAADADKWMPKALEPTMKQGTLV